ncbi:MAG: hypothetical protein JWP22_137, partial [Ramlibacter sp.]|nr:hypothetical protein [Ramlibacter sp.]
MDAQALRLLAQGRSKAACPECAALVAPGWEALPGTFSRDKLHRIGTLRDPEVEDPTLEEYHPRGTHAWSPDAPIATGYFPYNRCDVWECVRCGRPFLRYTEYGGYYVEERIRELHVRLIVDA